MLGTYTKPLLLVLAGIAIVGAVFLLESRKVDIGGDATGDQDIVIQDESERVSQKEKQYERAKEISTPDGFINTDGITIGEFIGKKVVLVDFWTYSCINCQRTLPHLNSWYEKYADDGLVIIGVHTPEFDFEKDYGNVERAVEKFGVEYPVVLDNDYSTWRSYKNQYWPRKYLIDIDGFIVYDHIGEGAYEETERRIVEALNERSRVLGEDTVEMSAGSSANVDEPDFSRVGSPEMYFGSSRIEHIANLPRQGCLSGVCTYEASGGPPLNTYELSGEWQTSPEYAELTSNGGSIFLRFSASKVNLVAGAEGAVRAEVYLDGEKVGELGGTDVEGGMVTITEHGLYNLVDLRDAYGEHLLEIRVLDAGLLAFTFTFG